MGKLSFLHPADIVSEITFEVVVQGRRAQATFIRPHKIRGLLDDNMCTLGGFLRDMVFQEIRRMENEEDERKSAGSDTDTAR